MTAVLTYADIEPQDTLHLWDPYLPYGDMALFFGPGSLGKGRMLCSIIASTVRGEPVGTSTTAGPPADVIVIFPEDKAGEQVAWRLRAAGLTEREDLARVHDLTRLPDGSRFKLSAAPRHPGHLGRLRALIGELRDSGGNPRLVIIDPLAAVLGWGTMATNAGARQLVEPLQDMADETGVAVVAVGHTTKAGVLQGSAGLMQALRLVYRVGEDPLNTAHRVISAEKANNLPPDTGDLRFTIAEDDGGNPRVIWLDRAAIDEQRRGWRDAFAAAPAAATRPLTPPEARAAGCDHSHTRYGTSRQCADCPAARLRKPADAPPARPRPVTPAAPGGPPAPATAAPRTAPGSVRLERFAASVARGGGTRALGEHLILPAAQGACAADAGAALAWAQPWPGMWIARTASASYAVAAARNY